MGLVPVHQPLQGGQAMSQYTKIDTSDPGTLPQKLTILRENEATVGAVSEPVLLRCKFHDMDSLTNVVVAVLVHRSGSDDDNPSWYWELMGADAFGEVAEIKHPIEWRPLPKDGEVVVPEELGEEDQKWFDGEIHSIYAGARAFTYGDIVDHFKEAKQ